MSSIHNIPEPTTAYRPVVDEPTPAPPTEDAGRRPDCAGTPDTSRPDTEIDAEVGGLTWLIVLILSGLVSRTALLFFGPFHAVPDDAAAWSAVGRRMIEQGPKAVAGEMPVYPLMMLGLDTVGLPLWIPSVLQAVLGIVAIAAVYQVGRLLTGRVWAGLGAAALMALHPGVLTWTTAAAPGGLACALVAIGLYLLVKREDGDPVNAWPGGIVLGLAALSAPAAWLVGLGAAWWCVAQGAARRGPTQAAIVLVLSVGPALAWLAVSDHGVAQLWTGHTAQAEAPRLTGLADQSLRELGTQLRFEMLPHGTLTRLAEGNAGVPAQRDAVADAVGDTWVVLNLLVLFAATISLAIMLVRQRYAAAACFAIPLLLLMVSGMPLDEPARLALFPPLALLAFGGLCTRAQPVLSAEEKEAQQHEKELARQAKIDAKFEKTREKHGLYAFDKNKRKPAKTAAESPPAEHDASPSAEPPAGQALAGPGEEPPAMMRPI